MLSLSKSKLLKETNRQAEICPRNRMKTEVAAGVCDHRMCLGCTCGGGNRAPSPSPADKAMLSPEARVVWTGYCRYGNEAGDFKQEVVSHMVNSPTPQRSACCEGVGDSHSPGLACCPGPRQRRGPARVTGSGRVGEAWLRRASKWGRWEENG